MRTQSTFQEREQTNLHRAFHRKPSFLAIQDDNVKLTIRKHHLIFSTLVAAFALHITGCGSQSSKAPPARGSTDSNDPRNKNQSANRNRKDKKDKTTQDDRNARSPTSDPSEPQEPKNNSTQTITDRCGESAVFGPPPATSGSTPRIVGGRPVADLDAIMLSTIKIFPMGCTGTLISKNLVITAAHCFSGAPQNFVGNLGFGFGSAGVRNTSLKATGVIIHPKSTKITFPYPQNPLYDVALIAFSGNIEAPYKPVLIANQNDPIAVGNEITLAGYGAYFNDDKTERPLTSVQIKIGEILPEFREIQLTQGDRVGGCNGDSGGPSYLISSDKFCLKLITTTTGPGRGVQDNCATGSGTLQDLRQYHGWIKCSAAKLQQPLGYLQDDSSASDCSSSNPVL